MIGACPKCKTVALVSPDGRASRLLRCPSCQGTWLPKDEARLEAVGALLSQDSTLRPNDIGDLKTGLCPDGHGILIRARIDLSPPFFLERCTECHGIWFDKGEWNELAGHHLLDELGHLWDPAWRAKLRQRRAEPGYVSDLEHTYGKPLLDAMRTVANALRERPHALREEALSYLRSLLEDPEA